VHVWNDSGFVVFGAVAMEENESKGAIKTSDIQSGMIDDEFNQYVVKLHKERENRRKEKEDEKKKQFLSTTTTPTRNVLSCKNSFSPIIYLLGSC
jgi:hypothetical protein